MRATGFAGLKSPKDASGELRFPLRKSDGTILDFGYKSITQARREQMYMEKFSHQLQEDEQKRANISPNAVFYRKDPQTAQMQQMQKLRSMVGRQFTTFGKADRFMHHKIELRRMPNKVGPGSYNSNPFKNIEAAVNASHHVYGYPVLGKPKGNKEQVYTIVNGAVILDDRFASLKQKRQVRRTHIEAQQNLEARAEARAKSRGSPARVYLSDQEGGGAMRFTSSTASIENKGGIQKDTIVSTNQATIQQTLQGTLHGTLQRSQEYPATGSGPALFSAPPDSNIKITNMGRSIQNSHRLRSSKSPSSPDKHGLAAYEDKYAPSAIDNFVKTRAFQRGSIFSSFGGLNTGSSEKKKNFPINVRPHDGFSTSKSQGNAGRAMINTRSFNNCGAHNNQSKQSKKYLKGKASHLSTSNNTLNMYSTGMRQKSAVNRKGFQSSKGVNRRNLNLNHQSMTCIVDTNTLQPYGGGGISSENQGTILNTNMMTTYNPLVAESLGNQAYQDAVQKDAPSTKTGMPGATITTAVSQNLQGGESLNMTRGLGSAIDTQGTQLNEQSRSLVNTKQSNKGLVNVQEQVMLPPAQIPGAPTNQNRMPMMSPQQLSMTTNKDIMIPRPTYDHDAEYQEAITSNHRHPRSAHPSKRRVGPGGKVKNLLKSQRAEKIGIQDSMKVIMANGEKRQSSVGRGSGNMFQTHMLSHENHKLAYEHELQTVKNSEEVRRLKKKIKNFRMNGAK